jgi:Zn-finger nucleic acid-binding protein
MMKYKISGAVANRVDVCSTCDDAWLDGGEWELLEALHLSHEIPAILTDAWQRRIRRELTAESRRSILVRMVGEEGARRVEEFGEWLDGSGHKSQVLTYLYKKPQ